MAALALKALAITPLGIKALAARALAPPACKLYICTQLGGGVRSLGRIAEENIPPHLLCNLFDHQLSPDTVSVVIQGR